MSRVNPPPALRLPPSLAQNQEARVYFEQINKILFQLWARTGGGNDDINDLLNDQSAIEGEVNEALGQIENVSRVASINALTAELVQTVGVNAASNTQALAALEAIGQALQVIALAPPVQPVIPYEDVSPPITPRKRIRSGMFYDTTTQTAAAINTAYSVTYNTTSITEGVYLGSPTSRIYVDEPGRYNVQFSVQIDKTSGGTALFYIWVAVNGTDVTDSGSQIQIQGNDAEIFSAANFFLDLKAGDYVELKWAVSDTSVQLQYFAASAFAPAIPSIIVTVANNIN
jgi:hypothetical protein